MRALGLLSWGKKRKRAELGRYDVDGAMEGRVRLRGVCVAFALGVVYGRGWMG